MNTSRPILRFERWERRILRLVREYPELVRVRQLDYSAPDASGARFPIYLLEIGKPKAFARASRSIVSGVHGLETIGVRIHLDLIRSILNPRSKFFSRALQKGEFGLYSIPILNPAGVALKTRANSHGVDLNRNSGIVAERAIPFFGGHAISAALPYYKGKTLQRETRALMRFYETFVWPKLKGKHLALDIHSGYGSENFLWWPYSFSKKPVYDEATFLRVAEILRKSHNLYRIEPMSKSYQTHGDLWDKALLEFASTMNKVERGKRTNFLPFTLEIGTWQEIKKSPMRIFDRAKIFNPPKSGRKAYLKAHRALISDFVHYGL